MRISHWYWRIAAVLPLLAVAALAGCKKLHHTDLAPLAQAGMWSSSVDQAEQYRLTDEEVHQLSLVRQSGMSDDACLALLRMAHSRPGGTFTDGQAITGLLGAGFSADSILELARLNQLGLWAGEAEAMRLANLSDAVVLSVARRRAAGEPVIASAKVAALQNAGLSEKAIIEDIDNGTTDEQADAIIYKKNYEAGGHTFVPAYRRRRR